MATLKKLSLRSIVRPVCIATFLCCSVMPAFARDIDNQEYSDKILAELKTMRYSGPIPSLTGFSPARVVTPDRLTGGKDYSTAYQSAAGCVVFFDPLEKGQHDLSIKWEGRKCDGQPVEGEGALSIAYKIDLPAETITRVFSFRGNFENGMLFGRGEKVNVAFDASGKLKESIYAFSGDFAYGLLNGLGRKTWTGPAKSTPSAHVVQGNFSEGTPLGEIIYSELHPYPGVVAETKSLIFGTNGRPFLTQENSKGAIFFDGDTLGWNTVVTSLKSDMTLGEAIFYRVAKGREGEAGSSLIAGCRNWDLRVDGLHCELGSVIRQAPGSSYRVNLTDKQFYIPMPFKISGSPIRVKENETISLHDAKGSAEDELTCNADLSSCRGKTILLLTARDYFSGNVTYDNGAVRPLSGLFLESTEPWEQSPVQDRKIAYCKEFRTPTDCRSGWLMQGVNSWTGSYVIRGIDFEAREGYLLRDSGFNFSMEGNGRFLWTEDQSWIDAYTHNNDFVSISSCDKPLLDGDFTCHLDSSGTIIFARDR